MQIEDLKWFLPALIIPLGWLLNKLFSAMSREEVKEFMELKMTPLKDHTSSLEDKIDDLERRLARVEDKIDQLPLTILRMLNHRKD